MNVKLRGLSWGRRQSWMCIMSVCSSREKKCRLWKPVVWSVLYLLQQDCRLSVPKLFRDFFFLEAACPECRSQHESGGRVGGPVEKNYGNEHRIMVNRRKDFWQDFWLPMAKFLATIESFFAKGLNPPSPKSLCPLPWQSLSQRLINGFYENIHVW